MAGSHVIDHRDLKELVSKYALDMLAKDEKKEVDQLNPEIDWTRLLIHHESTKYEEVAKALTTPKSHILFSAHFSNNTEEPQKYTLKTERKTRSTCQLNLERLFTIGAEVSLQLLPPNPIIQANAGFHTELSMNKSVSETFEEELTWAVDTDISVPKGFTVEAKLVIKEENYNAAFEIDTHFQGEVLVTFLHKKDKTHVRTVSCKVANVFTPKEGFKVEKNTEDPKKSVSTFTTKGKCKCSFGIQQEVGLTKRPLATNGEA